VYFNSHGKTDRVNRP